MTEEKIFVELEPEIVQESTREEEQANRDPLSKLREKLTRKVERTERKESFEEISSCPYCGNPYLFVDYTKGEVVCPRCGTVVSERLVDVTRPEYRIFTPEDVAEKERVHKVDLKAPEMGLGQDEIDVKATQSPLLERISKINRRIRVSSQERTLMNLMRIVKNIVQRHNIPSVVIEDVVYLYRQLAKNIDRKMFRVRELAVALLWISCKRHGLGFRIKEIENELGISRRRLNKLITKIKELLHRAGVPILSVYTVNENELKTYVHSVLEKLGVQGSIRLAIARLVMDIVKKCQLAHITCGRKTYTVVASAIYITTTIFNIKKRQKEIAEVTGVSDVSIRSRYREIMDRINIVIFV